MSHWEPREKQKMLFPAVDSATTISLSAAGSAGGDGRGGDYVGLDDIWLRKVDCFIVRSILFGCP